MQTVAKALDENISLNRAILDFQRARIPRYLQQARQYVSSGTSLNMAYHTQSQVLLRITCIIAIVGSPGSLVIGDRTIPINGTTVMYLGEQGLLIRPEDVVTLTQTVAGPLSLEFLGEEMADRGKRW